ncbi:ABC transporter ATP-binding protein [Jeotgalibacillus soli]|uniref:ABC transporter ATP-binding protein n=1 Tax=Jeotgalibacillus soli TaxID=889306 RepID=UPI000A05C7D0|nr:ABC transporter ATP-binding protein [Jeotgalibacillus soli]
MWKLQTDNMSICYGAKDVVTKINLTIPAEKITAIVGPNGSGKSTILRAISRMIPAREGNVFINGENLLTIPDVEFAKNLSILSQSPDYVSGLTTRELISYGRLPRKKGFGKLEHMDVQAVEWALDVTNMKSLADVAFEELSDGQRQKAWIAVTIAQDASILILDEPMTYLDLQQQLEVMKLMERLNKEFDKTIVMALHDLNQAARFADKIIAIKEGSILAEGSPADVLRAETLCRLYGIEATVDMDPKIGKLVCYTY